jgi:NAD(P)-dependent dehydrogenase (short-subunit alcohol dehydrogenase family)
LRVVATARRLEAMAGLASQGIQTLELDVTNEVSVHKTRDATAKLTGGKLDILVNNAYVLPEPPVSKILTQLSVDKVRFSCASRPRFRLKSVSP